MVQASVSSESRLILSPVILPISVLKADSQARLFLTVPFQSEPLVHGSIVSVKLCRGTTNQKVVLSVTLGLA